MKKISCFSIILLLVMCLMPLNVVADNTGGDVNNDGEVNIADVNTVIDYILGDKSRQSIDVNNDGEINIADVNAIIGVILKGTSATEEHEYVDLGLPSGTLWATCNVGASVPEEYGDYFAWGETAPKDEYYWYNYKWYTRDYYIKKYVTDSRNGFTDGKTELDIEDDAAFVNWGPSWRMPSDDQQMELINKCTMTWTTRNGVNGRLMTGPNGNSIFLPAAGRSFSSGFIVVGSEGYYWSRTLYLYDNIFAHTLNFGMGFMFWDEEFRYNGLSVRAVCVSQN